MKKIKKIKDRTKAEISKIEKELRKIDLKFPDLENKKVAEPEKKNEELRQENKNTQSEFRVNDEKEKETEFVAPTLMPSESSRKRSNLNLLEQTALDSPTITSKEENTTPYVGNKSAYLAGTTGYIGNQTYRSGNEKYSNQEIRPDLNRQKFDSPVFGTAPRERKNESSGFFTSERNQQSENNEEPRAITQYEIKFEEKSHHGRK